MSMAFLRQFIVTLVVAALGTSASLAQEGGAAPSQVPQLPDDYMVSRQDVLSVVVIDQPSLSQKYTVEMDGTVRLPLIGRVLVAGKTLHQIESELKRLLVEGQFFRNPQVAVSLDQFRGKRIFVGGN